MSKYGIRLNPAGGIEREVLNNNRVIPLIYNASAFWEVGEFNLYRFVVNDIPAWTSEELPPEDYGFDFIKIETQTETVTTLYCDSVAWDDSGIEEMDNAEMLACLSKRDLSGDGSKERPFKNLCFALAQVACGFETCTSCRNRYRIVVSGVVDYAVRVYPCDIPSFFDNSSFVVDDIDEFDCNERVIIDCTENATFSFVATSSNRDTFFYVRGAFIYGLKASINGTYWGGAAIAINDCSHYNCEITSKLDVSLNGSCLSCTITSTDGIGVGDCYKCTFNAQGSVVTGKMLECQIAAGGIRARDCANVNAIVSPIPTNNYGTIFTCNQVCGLETLLNLTPCEDDYISSGTFLDAEQAVNINITAQRTSENKTNFDKITIVDAGDAISLKIKCENLAIGENTLCYLKNARNIIIEGSLIQTENYTGATIVSASNCVDASITINVSANMIDNSPHNGWGVVGFYVYDGVATNCSCNITADMPDVLGLNHVIGFKGGGTVTLVDCNASLSVSGKCAYLATPFTTSGREEDVLNLSNCTGNKICHEGGEDCWTRIECD